MADYFIQGVVHGSFPAGKLSKVDLAVANALQLYACECAGEITFTIQEGLADDIYGEDVVLADDEDPQARSQELADLLRPEGCIGWERYLQHLCRKLELPYITVEVAFTCSKMREDGFGGAGYVITPDLIVSQSSGEWLDAKLEQLCLEPPRGDSKIPHRSPLDVLRRIAGTPKAGEPCPDDPTYSQTWHEDGGTHATQVLHDIIDAARSALAGADAPANPDIEQLRTANSEPRAALELATGRAR